MSDSSFDIAKAMVDGFNLYMKLSQELAEDLERNPPQRFLGLDGLLGRPCLSCGAKADFYGRIPCGH